jgi:hypothetical protein
MGANERGNWPPPEDPLVGRLVPHPGAVPLHGRVVRGEKEGSYRLYPTAALDQYVEFQDADVLFAKLDDNVGTVWLKPQARLRHVRTTTLDAQALMLAGEIIDGALSAGAAAAGTSPIVALAIGPRAVCTRRITGCTAAGC